MNLSWRTERSLWVLLFFLQVALLGFLFLVFGQLAPSDPRTPQLGGSATQSTFEQYASSNVQIDPDKQKRLLTECATLEAFFSQYRLFITKGHKAISEFHVILMCLVASCIVLQGVLVLNRRRI